MKWNPFRAPTPERVPVPVQFGIMAEVDRLEAAVATLEAQLNVQTRELGRLRAEDALKATVIADLRAKLDGAAPLPEKALLVLESMHMDVGYAAATLSSFTGVSEAQVRVIVRAFEAFGWAFKHAFHSEDDNLLRGSGYSLTSEGWALRNKALDAMLAAKVPA